MLFDSAMPFLRVSLAVILPAALFTSLFFFITFRLAYKAHLRKPVTGKEGLIGLQGITRTETGPSGGMVRVHGEIWSAWSDDIIAPDEKVIVETVQGLKVKVSRAKSA
jgi:membrane-bound serine protease (ClpP class)